MNFTFCTMKFHDLHHASTYIDVWNVYSLLIYYILGTYFSKRPKGNFLFILRGLFIDIAKKKSYLHSWNCFFDLKCKHCFDRNATYWNPTTIYQVAILKCLPLTLLPQVYRVPINPSIFTEGLKSPLKVTLFT